MAAYRQDVLSLPLAPSVRQKLKAAGFATTKDISSVVGPVQLATGRLLQLLTAPTASSAQRADAGTCSC